MDEQIEFDFTAARKGEEGALPKDSLERGFREFMAEQERGLQELERRFGVVLNRRVRLTLHGWDDEFEGKLLVDQLLYPRRRGEALRLRVGTMSFDHTAIATCVVLGDS